MKKLFTLVTLATLFCTFAQAQTESEKDYYPYSHWFVGLQGGAAMTLNGEYNNFKQITPTASFHIGWHPIKEFAIRAHANGIWSKSGIKYVSEPDGNYAYKYITADIDALINLVGIFGKKEWYPVNLYIVAGGGFTHMWDNKEAIDMFNAHTTATPMISPYEAPRNTFNARAGLLLDVSLSKHWSINLEADYNAWLMNTSGKFVIDNKQLTAQIGLAYKFGHKKKVKPEPIVESVPAPVPVAKKEEPKPAPVVKKEEPKPVPVAKEKVTKNVFYTIGKSVAKGEEAAKITAAADWMKAHPSAVATDVGYADKGTGSAAVNKKIAEKRAFGVADKLKKSGVSADRITVDSKGDTVQPFAENDKNRVAIITCEEK